MSSAGCGRRRPRPCACRWCTALRSRSSIATARPPTLQTPRRSRSSARHGLAPTPGDVPAVVGSTEHAPTRPRRATVPIRARRRWWRRQTVSLAGATSAPPASRTRCFSCPRTALRSTSRRGRNPRTRRRRGSSSAYRRAPAPRRRRPRPRRVPAPGGQRRARRAGAVRTGATPFNIAAAVTPAATPVLAGAPPYTVAAAGLVPAATEVLVGTAPLAASGGAPGPGQVTVSATSFTFAPPAAPEGTVAAPGPRQRHRVDPGGVGDPVNRDVERDRPGAVARASGRRRHGEPRWLGEVRLRAGRRVAWTRHRWQSHAYAEEHVLAITHSEVDRALEPRPTGRVAERTFCGRPSAPRPHRPPGGSAAGRRRPFAHLVGPSSSAAEAALLTLAPAAAVDPALTRVFGYLLDLTHPAHPTPALAPRFDQPPGPPPAPTAAGAVAARRAGGRPSSAAGLAGGRAAAARSAAADWSLGRPPPGTAAGAGRAHHRRGDRRVRQPAGGDGGGPSIEIELVGEPGSGRTARPRRPPRLRLPPPAADVAEHRQPGDPGGSDARGATGPAGGGRLVGYAERAARRLPGGRSVRTVSLAGRTRHGGPRGRRRFAARFVPAAPSAPAHRAVVVAHDAAPAGGRGWALRPAEVARAARVGRRRRRGRRGRPRFLTASRPDLLTPLPLPYLWTDLVLAPATLAHLRELEAQARHRGEVLDEWGFARLTALGRGTTALFSGPSGTGKTMAAQVLARSLGLELFRVDLAGVVNKYIGETEKHLRELFDMCERAPALLLFDEADALFGKRGAGQRRPRPLRQHRDRLPAPEDGAVRRARRSRHQPQGRPRQGVRPAPALHHRVRTAELEERARLWRLALEAALDAGGRALRRAGLGADWAASST